MCSYSGIYFLASDCDPDQSQNFMGSMLDLDPSSHFIHEDPNSSICAILLRNKQRNTLNAIVSEL